MRLSSYYFNFLLSVTAFFPIWLGAELFKSQILITALSIYILIIITSVFLLNYKYKNKYFIQNFILALIIFFSLDINFGFWLIFEDLFVSGKLNYLMSIIFISFLLLIIFYTLKKNDKNKFIFLIVLISLLLYNFISIINHSIKVERDFQFTNSKLSVKNEKTKKKLIIFLDEMAGPAAIDSSDIIGKKALESFKETFEMNNFKIYENAYSIYRNTVEAIPNLLNFNFSNKDLTKKLSGENFTDRKSKWYIKKNKFFDQNKSILTNQNLALNLCKHKHVVKCVTFTSNKLNSNYIQGFKFEQKDFLFDKLLKSNSIILKIFWRISLELNLFEEKSDFSYQKALFKNSLKEIVNIVDSTEYNHYVFHIVVPHNPFGFEFTNDKECSFNHTRTFIKGPKNEKNNKKYLKNYYHEVVCTNLFLKRFFKILKEKELFEKIDILVTSDTGIGISKGENKSDLLSTYSVLFAIKSDKKDNRDNQETLSSQFLFSKYFDKNFKDLEIAKIQNHIYEPEKKIFLNFNNLKELKNFP